MENKTTIHGIVRDRHFPPIIMDNGLRRLFFPPMNLVSKYVLAGQVVADLGSGPGYFTLPIAKVVSGASGTRNEGRVYAVDFDAKSIEKLKKKAVKHGYAEIIEARVSSASNVDFIPSDSVDFVFANGLLCCMTDHLGAVGEINRILKSDGTAYLSISKNLRRSDPRTVVKEEWKRLLSKNFKVLKEGEEFFNRWALVSPTGIDIRELVPDGHAEERVHGEHKRNPLSCCAPP